MEADNKPKPKGLVEVLNKCYLDVGRPMTGHRNPSRESGLRDAYDRASKLAEPFEARREALEKVAEAAKDYMVPTYGSYRRLMEALSAVPPLPEVQDGN